VFALSCNEEENTLTQILLQGTDIAVYFILSWQKQINTFYKFLGYNSLIERQCEREVKALLNTAL
jgi:hypothetical protein